MDGLAECQARYQSSVEEKDLNQKKHSVEVHNDYSSLVQLIREYDCHFKQDRHVRHLRREMGPRDLLIRVTCCHQSQSVELEQH